MKKRLLSIVLCLCLVVEMLLAIMPTAQASTNEYTQSSAVQWILRTEGTTNDIDNFAGVQCVDLVKWYITTLGHNLGSIGYAYNLYRYTEAQLNLPAWGWSRHYSDELPQPGDIVAFDAWAFGSLSDGHCGLIYDVDVNAGKYYYIDYNCGGNNEGGTKQEKTLHDFSCVIRPDWPYLFDKTTGTLTINESGSTSYYAWKIGSGASENDVKSVVISSGVTSIAKEAFLDCKNLESITIPDSVTSIGSYAFSGCINLKRITIPDHITTIEPSTFAHCESLESMVIPSGVTSIGAMAFYYCNGLKEIVIPNSVTSIEQQAFEHCISLTNIDLPDQLTEISGWLFQDCTNLTEIIIPPNVTKIGSGAFYDANLSTVVIPSRVTSLETNAFMSCENLTTVYIPISVVSMGSAVFGYCTSLRDVYYEGTRNQFSAAEPSYGSNIFFSCGGKVTVHYESSMPDNPPSANPENPPKSFIQQMLQGIKNIICTISILCPVDAEVYDAEGKLVGRIVNNVASVVDTDKIYIYVENDEKYIYFLSNDEFTVRLTATGEGTMEYTVQNLDVPSWTTLDSKDFKKVVLSDGKKMVSYVNHLDGEEKVDVPNVQLYILDENDNAIKKVLPDDNSTEVPIDDQTSVYTITFDTGIIPVKVAPQKTDSVGRLTSLPCPTYAGYTFNGWFLAPNSETQVTTNAVFTEDTTVYAQWTAVSANPDPTPEPSNPNPVTPNNPGNPGSSYVPSTTYTITTPTTAHGTVTVSPKSAAKGSTVTITTTPDDGYQLATLTVTDNNGKEVSLTDKGGGSYTFTMPGSKVSISAVFQLIETPWSNPFADVGTDAWYYDAVKFVNEKGLMNGVGNGLFAPGANLSRGMLTQILYNKDGQPTVTISDAFADVKPGAWYSNAVSWASEKGIVGGYGNGLFGPSDNITREQLAVMLWRYAGKPVPPNLLLDFTDASLASDYALDALRWAVDEGVINGKGNGILDPKGHATRAEAAQMLKNYLDK